MKNKNRFCGIDYLYQNLFYCTCITEKPSDYPDLKVSLGEFDGIN